jgi:hypothetical protein
MTSDTNIQIPLDEAEKELEAVLNSGIFRRSERLSRFLRYLGQITLEGKSHQLNEYTLALEVFDRGKDYSPSEDSLVRVQARELRRRLAEYYQTEKAGHPFLIELPKGAYSLRFLRVSSAPSTADKIKPEPPHPPRGALSPLSDYSFYSEIFDNPVEGIAAETLLVLSNPLILVYAEGVNYHPAYVNKKTIPVPPSMRQVLAQYSSTPPDESQNLQLHPTNHQNTGIGEAYCAFHVGRLMQALNRPVWLTQSRFLSWETTRQHHLILLGSPFMHPWTHKNVPRKGYLLHPFRIDNTDPLPGEPETLAPTFDEASAELVEDYGLITLLTTSAGYRQIILAGITSPATQAVGEFFCDPVKMGKAYAAVKTSANSPTCPSDFQILLKTKVEENIPIETHYSTCRILNSD